MQGPSGVGKGPTCGPAAARAHQEGALAHARLLQDAAQRLQRVLQHVLGGQVDLGDNKEGGHLQAQGRGQGRFATRDVQA